MREPVLVIMAAGMGSRFGGPKQIKAVDDMGHAIIDYSLYDAKRAGFKKVAFIIKRELEEDFKLRVGRRAEEHFDVEYVYQELDRLPEGFSVPEGRVKPWGTGHAVLCCEGQVDAPFAVINADDFYGPGAYSAIYDFLSAERPESEYAMVGYRLRNTVTDNGYVARGICESENGFLRSITERTHIEKDGDDAVYVEDGKRCPVSGDTLVSMNFWGFSPMMLRELRKRFPAFLEKAMVENPLKGEYFLPAVADAQLKEGIATVRTLPCSETWYGMTYLSDLDCVKSALLDMRSRGIYPDRLLD